VECVPTIAPCTVSDRALPDHGEAWPASFAKLFAGFSACGDGWAALCRGDERLEFRFDPKEVQYLGLWFTNGGWHGFTHLAIEPAGSMAGSLAEDGSKLLPPSGEYCWRFEIGLSAKES
jgi:hypothetical protein